MFRHLSMAVLVACSLAVGETGAQDTFALIPGQQLRPSSDGEQPRLGTAMAYTPYLGGRLLVGLPGEDGTIDDVGATIVYKRVDGTWQYVVQILAPSNFRQENAGFGKAVAVSGEWAIVGAPDEDIGGTVDAGAVYFYRYNPANDYYQYHSRSEGSIIQAGARLGSAVAIGGGRAAAGQPGYNQNSIDTDTGRVQMFRFEFDTWFIDGALLSPQTVANESFGATLFLQDLPGAQLDRLFVGAPTTTVNGQAVAGRVHHFRHDGTDPAGWEYRESMEWLPSDLLDWYGSSIAANGAYLFIGARGRNKPGGSAKSGAVQVQKLDASGFYQPVRELYPIVSQAGARFGASLAVTSTFPPRLIVGTPGFDRTVAAVVYEEAGRVNVFDPILPGAPGDYDWDETNILGIAGTPGADDELGTSVAIGGYTTPGSTPVAFAGAPGRDAVLPEAGRVQVYVGDVIYADGFGGLQ